MENVVLQVKNMDCPSCSKKIEKVLNKNFGDRVEIAFDLGTRQLNVDYDNSISIEDIISAIKQAGYNSEIVEE